MNKLINNDNINKTEISEFNEQVNIINRINLQTQIMIMNLMKNIQYVQEPHTIQDPHIQYIQHNFQEIEKIADIDETQLKAELFTYMYGTKNEDKSIEELCMTIFNTNELYTKLYEPTEPLPDIIMNNFVQQFNHRAHNIYKNNLTKKTSPYKTLVSKFKSKHNQ